MPSFRGGGAERVMVTLARGLAASGCRTDLVVAQTEGPNLPLTSDGIRIVDLGARRVLAALPGLVTYLRRERPAAVLSALPHCNVVAVWARRAAGVATRLVVSEHTIPSESARHSRLRRARILPHFMRRAYPKADAIVAVSDGVAANLAVLAGVSRSRITCIYNPIVAPAIERLAAEPVDHPWLEAGQPAVVLGVGRLTAAKDYSTLVRAFARLRTRRACRLVILGEGEDRARLEALAGSLGVGAEVSLPGYVANPFAYMARAALFVSSSRWEGFGNALVEAMACGTPVIATDCDGPREILEDGRHGPLTPVGDVAALAGAIESELGRPPRATLVTRAQAFTVDAALKKYREVLAV
jgi:glycosyltransferase involved in cell wall biosynthesis